MPSGSVTARDGETACLVKIDSVEFVRSASRVAECPAGSLPEVAVSGRSNVGKSSLINDLLGRRALARVSATPGKTQLLNYFRVNEQFHLVDLPGYGYARAPAATRERWRAMMQGYLRTRQQLTAVVQLVDSRHEPSGDDREMIQWLRDERLPFCLVPTKMDKLRRGERNPALARIVATLDLPEDQPMVPYSSQAGEGRDALRDWIARTLAAATSR